MKLNLIFLLVVLVLQYEWLGVNCGCQNIDSLESFKQKTQGGNTAVLMMMCGTDPDKLKEQEKQKGMFEEQCGKQNVPCYENHFPGTKIPEQFKPLGFHWCPSYFIFKNGQEVKRLDKNSLGDDQFYQEVDAMCAQK